LENRRLSRIALNLRLLEDSALNLRLWLWRFPLNLRLLVSLRLWRFPLNLRLLVIRRLSRIALNLRLGGDSALNLRLQGFPLKSAAVGESAAVANRLESAAVGRLGVEFCSCGGSP